jgi:hypothetical protein
MGCQKPPAADELDLEPIRRQAAEAARDFFEKRFDSYLDLVRQVEAWPENQSGADKGWVEEASEEYWSHYRNAVRVK